MNFFTQQHKARQRTSLLVLYFILAIVLIVVAVNVAAYVIFYLSSTDTSFSAEPWFEQPYWIWISVATILVIMFGTVRDLVRLGGGGTAVAEMVGARRISSATSDPDEKRLINVVEEMSIASGTPRPALYVMDDEPAINAFVAGYRPTEAVLVVTRGALQTFDRDELQGVIGHEYSHILNGDMRLNIRLWGIVSGILLIGQIGHFLIRSLRYSGSSRKGKGQGMAAIFVLGLALFIIGYIGLFFGRLIKAAVSRQREFLADASSVQFTRNPDGIAGALWKIKENTGGSLLNNEHAEDVSHLCFGPSLNFSLENLFATHPPLDDRIRAVDPGFIPHRKAKTVAGPGAPAAPGAAMGFAGGGGTAVTATSEQITASVGNISSAHLDFAASLHQAMPPALLEALRGEDGVACVIYGLLLAGSSTEHMNAACEIIKTRAGESTAERASKHAQQIARLGARARLPIINLALPTLKMLNQDARKKFLDTVVALIRMDKKYTLFEFTLLTILQDHLAATAHKADKAKYFKYEDVLEELRILFTVVARTGTSSLDQVQKTFRDIMGTFTKTPGEPVPEKICTMQCLSATLMKLGALSPLLKQSVITACADCVLHDGVVQPGEAELLQAIAASLDCPMPPLV